MLCEFCGAVNNLLHCDRCRSVYYCCTEHQRQHWQMHKQVCIGLSTAATSLVHSQPDGIAASDYRRLEPDYPAATTQQASASPFNAYGSTYAAAASAGDYNDAALPPVYYDLNSHSLRSDGGGLTLPATDIDSLSWLPDADINPHNRITSFFEEVPVATGGGGGGDQARGSLDDGGEAAGYATGGGDFDESLTFLLDGLTVPTAGLTSLPTEGMASYRSKSSGSAAPTTTMTPQATGVRPVNERLQSMIECVIRDMNNHGICVIDNFMGPVTGTQILREVAAMYDTGVFEDGKVLSSPSGNASHNVRGDKILWVNGKEDNCRNIRLLIRLVDAVVMNSNRMDKKGMMGRYQITDRTKAMVACYPGNGTQYVKHVDNPNKDGRCITSIYYLNHNWDPKTDGGVLRIFPKDCKEEQQVANIMPDFDRILFFWSDRRNPHEVLPALRTRYAITLWYYDKTEREYARRIKQQVSRKFKK